jgi:hypothetical protein
MSENKEPTEQQSPNWIGSILSTAKLIAKKTYHLWMIASLVGAKPQEAESSSLEPISPYSAKPVTSAYITSFSREQLFSNLREKLYIVEEHKSSNGKHGAIFAPIKNANRDPISKENIELLKKMVSLFDQSQRSDPKIAAALEIFLSDPDTKIVIAPPSITQKAFKDSHVAGLYSGGKYAIMGDKMMYIGLEEVINQEKYHIISHELVHAMSHLLSPNLQKKGVEMTITDTEEFLELAQNCQEKMTDLIAVMKIIEKGKNHAQWSRYQPFVVQDNAQKSDVKKVRKRLEILNQRAEDPDERLAYSIVNLEVEFPGLAQVLCPEIGLYLQTTIDSHRTFPGSFVETIQASRSGNSRRF